MIIIGIPIKIPFPITTSIRFKYSKYNNRAHCLSFSKDQFPKDRFHNEVTKYMPGADVFKMTDTVGLRSTGYYLKRN